MLTKLEDINKVRVLERVLYEVMISIRGAIDNAVGQQESYDSEGVLLDSMYESFSMMAILFNVTTATITKEQKEVLKVTLSYGTWIMAVKGMGVGKVAKGEDIDPLIAELLALLPTIKVNGISDANLAALYTQFGLTAP